MKSAKRSTERADGESLTKSLASSSLHYTNELQSRATRILQDIWREKQRSLCTIHMRNFPYSEEVRSFPFLPDVVRLESRNFFEKQLLGSVTSYLMKSKSAEFTSEICWIDTIYLVFLGDFFSRQILKDKSQYVFSSAYFMNKLYSHSHLIRVPDNNF